MRIEEFIDIQTDKLIVTVCYGMGVPIRGRLPITSQNKQSKNESEKKVRRSAADMDHGAGGFEESRFADVVTRLFGVNGVDDEATELVIGGVFPGEAVEVVFPVGEQACADFAVGGEADAAASAAKCLGDGRDDADFSVAVGESVASGGFAGGIWRERTERVNFLDALDDLGERNDHGRCPEAALFEGHELDESDDDVFLAGKRGEVLDLIVVEAAHEDAVDFDGAEARLLRGADAADNGGKAALNACDALEGGLIDGIHADRDAVEAGFAQGARKVFEQMAVGGDGDVEASSRDGAHRGELFDDGWQVAAKQRLAAGEADFFNAERDEDADQPEIFGSGQLGVLRADFASATVDTFVIAAVGDGDAEVGDGSPVTVAQPVGMIFRIRACNYRWDHFRDHAGEGSHPSIRLPESGCFAPAASGRRDEMI